MASVSENSIRGACHNNVITKAALRSLNPVGKEFYVWPGVGSDTNDGLSPATALESLQVAHDKTTAEKHDTVYLIASDTADEPTSAITWDHDMTHLIGLGPEFPGIGSRSRIVGTATNAIGVGGVLVVSGRGCIIKNIQVQNLTAAASGGVLVSGPYNYFENVYFNGMNATAGAQAGTSFCLKVTGAENVFKNCTIGSCQIARTSTNAALIITTGAELFEDCLIQGHSETAGNFLVSLPAGTGGLSLLRFNDCTFYCQTVNWATGMTDAFNCAQTGSYYVLAKDCALIGGSGHSVTWADDASHFVLVSGAAAANNGGIGIEATS